MKHFAEPWCVRAEQTVVASRPTELITAIADAVPSLFPRVARCVTASPPRLVVYALDSARHDTTEGWLTFECEPMAEGWSWVRVSFADIDGGLALAPDLAAILERATGRVSEPPAPRYRGSARAIRRR